MQAAAIAASLFVCATPAAIAQAPPASCRGELEANEVRFKETIARLESVKNGTQAQKCAAYRSHVEIMKRAIPIFDRCTSGLGRCENVGQMNDSIEDFEELIRRRCAR
jgi:hypothetical protein